MLIIEVGVDPEIDDIHAVGREGLCMLWEMVYEIVDREPRAVHDFLQLRMQNYHPVSDFIKELWGISGEMDGHHSTFDDSVDVPAEEVVPKHHFATTSGHSEGDEGIFIVAKSHPEAAYVLLQGSAGSTPLFHLACSGREALLRGKLLVVLDLLRVGDIASTYGDDVLRDSNYKKVNTYYTVT